MEDLRFALVMHGSENMGFVEAIQGGIIRGEVTTYDLGPDNVQKKHLATITHEPFIFKVGMGMRQGFYEWIGASFDAHARIGLARERHVIKTGEFVRYDRDGNAVNSREFIDAHIAEVTIPSLDGNSKEPAYMTVKLDPERIRYKPGDGTRASGGVNPTTKKWLSSGFRFQLADLPCDHVAKIDSFTWKQGVIKDEVGAFREATKHPSKVEVPDIELKISMADLEPWQDWHKSFVIDGNCTDSDELSGAITFLGPDLGEELAEIELQHVGLISLEMAGLEADLDEAPCFTVELYVEQMTFNYTAAR